MLFIDVTTMKQDGTPSPVRINVQQIASTYQEEYGCVVEMSTHWKYANGDVSAGRWLCTEPKVEIDAMIDAVVGSQREMMDKASTMAGVAVKNWRLPVWRRALAWISGTQ